MAIASIMIVTKVMVVAPNIVIAEYQRGNKKTYSK